MSKPGIIRPFWFEYEDSNAMTMNSERYIKVLNELWAVLGHRRSFQIGDHCFKQDGATPHTANESHEVGDKLLH